MSTIEEPPNRLATVSLVVGVIGIVGALTFASLGAFVGSLAVVLGFVARRQPERGRTAIAGIVAGLVAVVVGVVSVLVLTRA